jgi:hypothetical protein
MPGPDYIGPTTPGNVNLVTAFSNALPNSVSLDPLSNLYGSGCVPSGCLPVPGAWMPPFSIETGGVNYAVPSTSIIDNPLDFGDALLPLIGGGTVGLDAYLLDPSGYEINSTGLAIGGFPLTGQTCDEMYTSLASFFSERFDSSENYSYEIILPLITSYTNTSDNYISVSGWCPDANFADVDASGIIPGYSGDFVQSTWESIL